MIQYLCDHCKRELAPGDLRYVVRVEVSQAFEPTAEEPEDERDYLQEVHEMLETVDDVSDVDGADDIYRQMRFDLCPACHRKFLKNPLGQRVSPQLNFSEN